MSDTRPMSDPRPGVSVPPPVTAAQRSVLYAVRRRGEATVVDIARVLDITSSGARQHLSALVDAGLLEAGEATRVAGQHGRSERTYSIAPAAETLFPRAYGELTNQLLAYVPPGSIAKGEAIVTTGGGGKTLPCAICHGPGLKGLGDVPNIAGRSPGNIARQIYYFQTGDRGGPNATLMKGVVEKLNGDDVLAISAYVASLEP